MKTSTSGEDSIWYIAFIGQRINKWCIENKIRNFIQQQRKHDNKTIECNRRKNSTELDYERNEHL